MIPIENSLAGRVADIHYFFQNINYKFMVNIFLPVEHNLLGKADATIEDIKYVRSHAQAISQCQKIIKRKILNQLFQ